MTTVKRYFRAHMRANLRPLIYLLATVLILTFLLGMSGQPITEATATEKPTVVDYRSTLYIPVVFLCLLTYVLPVLEFSFFKRRINLDCAYALPISRRAMGTVHYLSGLILLYGAFTVSYLLNLVMLLSRGIEWFSFPPMLAHYALCLVLGFAMYSVMVFVFNEANTRGDGIWFMLLYTFAPVLAVLAVLMVSESIHVFAHIYPSIPWGMLGQMTQHYQYLAELDTVEKAVFWQSAENVGWFVFWVVLGLSAAVGFFLTFGKRRMEKTEERSDSFFGFRVLIPVYAVCGMLAFASMSIFFWLIIELLALLGYTIYRRGFHYKKSDLAVLVLLLVFLLI